MLLVLLESGDEVVRVPAVPAELVLLQGRDVDVLPEKRVTFSYRKTRPQFPKLICKLTPISFIKMQVLKNLVVSE